MEDRTADGRWVPGGPALYSAIAAARLGAHVTLITRITPEYDRTALAGIRSLISIPAKHVPRYANSYDAAGNRAQLLLHPGEPLEIPEGALAGADATILAPAFNEFADTAPRTAGLVAVALQGALRAVSQNDVVIPIADPAKAVRRLVRGATFLFLSVEDLPNIDSFLCESSSLGARTILTRGAAGATLVTAAERTFIPPVAARQVDPTGAGDCFLAAFVVRLLETGSETEAGRFAAAAGALNVEGSGIDAIPLRSAIEHRLQELPA